MKQIHSATKNLRHKVYQSNEIQHIKLSETLCLCDFVAIFYYLKLRIDSSRFWLRGRNNRLSSFVFCLMSFVY